MPGLLDLILCYGICFGAMNKIDFMRKIGFFDRMLSCSYCTGFHAGWIGWAVSRLYYPLEDSFSYVATALLWAFASSAFCYFVDVLAQLAEGWTPVEKASQKEDG